MPNISSHLGISIQARPALRGEHRRRRNRSYDSAERYMGEAGKPMWRFGRRCIGEPFAGRDHGMFYETQVKAAASRSVMSNVLAEDLLDAIATDLYRCNAMISRFTARCCMGARCGDAHHGSRGRRRAERATLLGVIYCQSRDIVPVDYSRGMRWFRKSAVSLATRLYAPCWAPVLQDCPRRLSRQNCICRASRPS